MSPDGCAFRVCTSEEVLDLATGRCIPRAIVSGPATCPEGTSALVERAHGACVPADVTCPRGSHREGNVCSRVPRCPPGTLPFASGCRPLVGVGPNGIRVVDLGGWAALALGPDGGMGTPELCRPLAQHPGELGLAAGESRMLRLSVSLSVPDQDVSRVTADVQGMWDRWADPRADGGAGEGGNMRATSPGAGGGTAAADAAAASSVETLVEALRGLGGEASAASAKVEVRCLVTMP